MSIVHLRKRRPKASFQDGAPDGLDGAHMEPSEAFPWKVHGAKMGPRQGQEMAKKPPREAKRAKMGPKWGEDEAKRGQHGAKMGPRGAKMGPRWSQDGARKGPWSHSEKP